MHILNQKNDNILIFDVDFLVKWGTYKDLLEEFLHIVLLLCIQCNDNELAFMSDTLIVLLITV